MNQTLKNLLRNHMYEKKGTLTHDVGEILIIINGVNDS